MPWAYRVARFQLMAYRKRVSRDRHMFSLSLLEKLAERAASHPAAHAAADEIAILESCMDKLTEQQREYVAMRYSDGLAVQEIAAQTHQTENAVAATLYRARLALAKCMEAKFQVPLESQKASNNKLSAPEADRKAVETGVRR